MAQVRHTVRMARLFNGTVGQVTEEAALIYADTQKPLYFWPKVGGAWLDWTISRAPRVDGRYCYYYGEQGLKVVGCLA
jgi:hypothetical protein